MIYVQFEFNHAYSGWVGVGYGL